MGYRKFTFAAAAALDATAEAIQPGTTAPTTISREQMVAIGLIRPRREGSSAPTVFRNVTNSPVLRMDDAGRAIAARAVALGLRGIHDESEQFEGSHIPRRFTRHLEIGAGIQSSRAA